MMGVDVSDVKRLELDLASYKMASDAARRALAEERNGHAVTILERDALKAERDRLRAELADARRLLKCLLDKPEDRLWHAEDGTWWRREGDRLRSAEPPPGWTRATPATLGAWTGCDAPDDHEVDAMHGVAEDERDTWLPDGAPTSGRTHLYGHAPGCLPGETPAGDWACVPGCPKLGGDEQAFRGILAGTKWPATDEERRHEDGLRRARQEAWDRPAVAPEVLRERSPRRPDELVGAMHDSVHRDSSKLRMAIPLGGAAVSGEILIAETTGVVARAVESLEISLRAMDYVDATDGAREGVQLAHDVLTEWLKEDLRRFSAGLTDVPSEPHLAPEERHLLEPFLKPVEVVRVASEQRTRFLVEDDTGEMIYGGPGPTPVVVAARDENEAVDVFRRWVTKLRMKPIAPGDYQCRCCGKAMEMKEGTCSSRCG